MGSQGVTMKSLADYEFRMHLSFLLFCCLFKEKLTKKKMMMNLDVWP